MTDPGTSTSTGYPGPIPRTPTQSYATGPSAPATTASYASILTSTSAASASTSTSASATATATPFSNLAAIADAEDAEEEFSPPQQQRRSLKTTVGVVKKKRVRVFTDHEKAAHRRFEKSRRESFKISLTELAAVVPETSRTDPKRLSKHVVTNESTRYIRRLVLRCHEALGSVDMLLAERDKLLEMVNRQAHVPIVSEVLDSEFDALRVTTQELATVKEGSQLLASVRKDVMAAKEDQSLVPVEGALEENEETRRLDKRYRQIVQGAPNPQINQNTIPAGIQAVQTPTILSPLQPQTVRVSHHLEPAGDFQTPTDAQIDSHGMFRVTSDDLDSPITDSGNPLPNTSMVPIPYINFNNSSLSTPSSTPHLGERYGLGSRHNYYDSHVASQSNFVSPQNSETYGLADRVVGAGEEMTPMPIDADEIMSDGETINVVTRASTIPHSHPHPVATHQPPNHISPQHSLGTIHHAATIPNIPGWSPNPNFMSFSTYPVNTMGGGLYSSHPTHHSHPHNVGLVSHGERIATTQAGQTPTHVSVPVGPQGHVSRTHGAQQSHVQHGVPGQSHVQTPVQTQQVSEYTRWKC